MHTYLIFNIFDIIDIAWDFFDCSSLFLPLNLFTLVVSVAPKRKSTPARNPLRSDASLSSDPSPSNIRFHDGDALKEFSKNFFRRGIHSEHQVILSDFADTDFPSIIHSRGWKSLCDVPVTCSRAYPGVLLQHARDWSFSTSLFTRVRGTCIPITLQLVADVL